VARTEDERKRQPYKQYDNKKRLEIAQSVSSKEDIKRVAKRYEVNEQTLLGWYMRLKAFGPEDFAEDDSGKPLRGMAAILKVTASLDKRLARIERELGLPVGGQE
jgi:transposase-like protein